LLDAGLVHAFDQRAADQGSRDGGVAEAPDHVGLDRRGGRVEDAVFDVVAGEDLSHLPAIGAPRGVVEHDALAAPGPGRVRAEAEQTSGRRRTDEGEAAENVLCHSFSPKVGALVVRPEQMLHIGAV
jgi:hypothetical protein